MTDKLPPALRLYAVYVRGYDPSDYMARSASQARYRAWLAYKDAGMHHRVYEPDETFRDFLKRITMTLALGPILAKGPTNV